MTKTGSMGFLAAVMCLVSANNVSALSYVWNVSTGSWSNPASWNLNNGLIPGVLDTAFVRNNQNATIDSDVGTIVTFNVGEATANGTITITNGGKLVTSSASVVVGRPAAGTTSTGYVNQVGGTLQIGGAAGDGVMQIGVNGATTPCTGILTVSGGTFTGRLLVGSAVAGDSGDKVRIIGDAGIIGATSITGSALEVRASGSLEFVFDATGISTMDYGASGVGGTATFAAGSSIIINGANYTNQTGSAVTFNLIKAGTLGAANATVILTNFVTAATYDWNTATDVLSVSVSSPLVKSLKLMMIQ